MASTNSQKEDVVKPIQNPQIVEDVAESHGRREDLTADTEVRAPGIVQRVAEEVQAIAAEVWAAITPGSKK